MAHAAHGGPLEDLADILKSQGKNAEVVSVLREYLGLLESFDAVAWPVQDDRMHSLGLHQDRPRHLARVAVSLAEAISRVDDPSWPEVEANMRRAMSTFSDDPSMVQGWEGQFELSDYHSLLARALEEQSKFAEGEGERRKARSLLHAASQHTQVHPSHILWKSCSLAEVLLEQRKFREAEVLAREVANECPEDCQDVWLEAIEHLVASLRGLDRGAEADEWEAQLNKESGDEGDELMQKDDVRHDVEDDNEGPPRKRQAT